MRLVDFLIHLLRAHAQTLSRLAAIIGEAELMEALESLGDSPTPDPEPRTPEGEWLDPAVAASEGVYTELEGAVREINLPAMLEFHLWAYPHYRAFVESPLDLASRIRGPGGNAGLQLVDEAIAQAETWVRRLPFPPELARQAEEAAHVPWLRFRAEVLKRIGKRPLGPVY